WDWELGLRCPPGVRLFCIPREVMEERAVEAGDIRFFELSHLRMEARAAGSGSATTRSVQLRLCDFVMPSADLHPVDRLERIKHWSDWIDSWAVDWDFRGDTFVSCWRSHRTRRNPALELVTPVHSYLGPGTYRVLVKVTDLFGNETAHPCVWESD